jgi:hypothetical protein
MNSTELNIGQLSSHLFWDVDIHTLSFNENKQFILKRIIEYGFLSDWLALTNHMGIEEIADVLSSCRELDPRALSFIASLSKRSKDKFLCSTTQQSSPRYWNF